jgi:hypothetical protein
VRETVSLPRSGVPVTGVIWGRDRRRNSGGWLVGDLSDCALVSRALVACEMARFPRGGRRRLCATRTLLFVVLEVAR